jgi:hypothetical protein
MRVREGIHAVPPFFFPALRMMPVATNICTLPVHTPVSETASGLSVQVHTPVSETRP